MRTDFLPRRDADLRDWAAHLAECLAVDPMQYGVPPALAQAFIDCQRDFAAALAVALGAAQRTVVTVHTKNELRRSLELSARQVAALARATPSVSDEQRRSLGLRLRKEGRTRATAPASQPRVWIVSAVGNAIEVHLTDSVSGRRARPAQVEGAALFTAVGPTPPVSIEGWDYRGNVTRCRTQLHFPADTQPGARVWCRARWYGGRGQAGPVSDAVCTNLPGGAFVLTRPTQAA